MIITTPTPTHTQKGKIERKRKIASGGFIASHHYRSHGSSQKLVYSICGVIPKVPINLIA